MTQYRRYAVYYTPPPGRFADFGASWLGWDLAAGQPVIQPVLPGLDLPALTAEPRKYGFHATLKAPFRLAEGRRPEDLALALQLLCDHLAPFTLALEPRTDWGFVSLRPRQQPPELLALESSAVTRLDEFRAPLTPQEYERRRPDALPDQARRHLDH